MTGVCGFLKERENGSFRSTQYRKCHRHVKDWLERLSASPVLNQPCEFSGEPKATFLVDFSPERTKIASAHGDHTVRVTEVATGKCTHILTGHPRTPWCLAFHPSHDDILASGCLGGQVRIWDLRGGGSEVFNSNSNAAIASLTFHPIDRVLVFSTKNRLYFWDWTQSEPFECCTTAYDFARVRWVKFDALGHYLYTGICNNTTVTRASVYDVGNRNERYNSLSTNPNWQERQQLNRQRYERLVSQIREDQQQRLLNSDVPDRPTSPVHLDRLRQAYSYARYVTDTSRDSYNRIQMAQRRLHRGGATEGEELLPSSPSRPSVARHSMFSGRSLRPQPGANSPPPRPLPDSDLQDQVAEQQRRPELDAGQDDQAGRSDSTPVGTSWSSRSRDQQQPDETERSPFLQFCHAYRRRREAVDDSRESSTSSSTMERGSTQSSTQTSAFPGDSSNARRMRFDAQLIGSALQAHTLTSRREPGSGRRGRLDDQSTDSSDARSTLGSRRRRRARMFIPYLYQSSDPSDPEQRRSNGEGDSTPIASPYPVQPEESRESSTGAALMESRGTLYSMLSRHGSSPSSAFSAPSRRIGVVPSIARTVPSTMLPTSSVQNTSSSSTSLSSLMLRAAARQTLCFGVFPLPQSTLPDISGNSRNSFDGQVSSALPSFSSSASSSSTSSPYISVWGSNADLLTSTRTSHSSAITSSLPSSSSSFSSTARNISVWGNNNSGETTSTELRSSLTAYTCPSSSAETLDSSGLNSREERTGLNSEAALGSLNPEVASSSSVNSTTVATVAPSTSSAANKRSYLTAFGTFSSSESTSQLGPQSSQTVSVVTSSSSTSSSASGAFSQSHLDAGSGIAQDSDQTDFPLPPSRQPRLSSREGTASSSPTSSSSSSSSLPHVEPQPAYSPPLGEPEYIPGSVSCRYLTHWLTRVTGAADSSWPRSSVLVDVNRIRRLAFVSPTWSCDLVNPLNRSVDASDSSNSQRCSVCWCVPSARPVGAYRQYITGRITDDLLRVRIRERTMDGTSQTQGQLNEPEHADRGTDIAGLAQFGQMDAASSSFHTRTGGAQEGTPVATDLERQLSENDDEISRIESSYREEMQRLADQRRRILSTMRGSRPHTSGATVDCSSSSTASSSSSPAVTDPSAQAGSSSAQGHAPSDLIVAGGGGRAAGISCSAAPTSSTTTIHSAASSWSTIVSCSAEARPVSGQQTTTPALSGASAQSSALQAGSSNSNNQAPASSPMEASGWAQQPETAATPPVSSANSDSSQGAGAASRLSLADSDDGSGSVSGAGSRCPAGPPLHTLPSATGSDNNRIEVLTGPSGESETISYSELARRLANREDVTVVGNHRLAPPSSSSFSSASLSSSTPSVSSSSSSSQVLARSSQHRSGAAVERSATGDGAAVIGRGGGVGVGGGAAPSASVPLGERSVFAGAGERGRSHLLRTCLVNPTTSAGSRLAPVPPPHSSAESTNTSTATGRRAPPVILVQQAAPEDQSDGLNRENRGRSSGRDADWYGLEQRHLHPHYSRSILDDTINRPNDVVQSAINRAIAGVFMSSGEQAVASNIVPGTHRIQRWDFRNCDMPDLTQHKANIVVEHCKIHNDASIDMSRDSSLLATFVNNHGGFPDDNILAVFSLRPESFGQCLYTKSFGPNAISVSLSPSNQYVMVGLASKRTMWIQVTDQLVGQILKLNKPGAGEYSMVHVTDLYHPVRRVNPVMMRGVSPVSVNSARWLPDVGEGIVYGTNHGDLHFYRAGRTKAGLEEEEAKPRKLTISTQTGTGSIRRSAFTQTVDEETAN